MEKKRGDEKEAGICTLREGITFAVQLGGRLRTSSLVILLLPFFQDLRRDQPAEAENGEARVLQHPSKIQFKEKFVF